MKYSKITTFWSMHLTSASCCSSRWGEAISLNCGHKQAYCTSPTWCTEYAELHWNRICAFIYAFSSHTAWVRVAHLWLDSMQVKHSFSLNFLCALVCVYCIRRHVCLCALGSVRKCVICNYIAILSQYFLKVIKQNEYLPFYFRSILWTNGLQQFCERPPLFHWSSHFSEVYSIRNPFQGKIKNEMNTMNGIERGWWKQKE